MKFGCCTLHRGFRRRLVATFNRFLNLSHIGADAAAARAVDLGPAPRPADTFLGGLEIRHSSTCQCFIRLGLRLISVHLPRVNLDSLTILEGRLTFFNEGLHAFLLIFGGEHRMEGTALE